MIFSIMTLLLIASTCSIELRKLDFYGDTPLQNSTDMRRNLLLSNILVKVDFGPEYHAKNSVSGDILFGISLSSSETFLSYAPKGLFRSFNCDPTYCTENNSTFMFNSLWASGITRRININTNISIAYGAWQLKIPGLHFNSTSPVKGPRDFIYGWVGLGTDSEANKNFRDSDPIFSLLVNKTPSGNGSLIFGFDSNIADINSPLMVVTSDKNWKMQLISISFGSLIYLNADEPLPMMFDLKFSGITLPKTIRNNLQTKMGAYNLTCFSSATCGTLDLAVLPSLDFGLADGKVLSLRPSDYMKPTDEYSKYGDDFDYDYYFLNLFKNEDLSYYEDHIVLGWNVLAAFYALFEQKNEANTIKFYEIGSASSPTSSVKPEQSPSNGNSLFIIIGIILIIIIFAYTFVRVFGRKKILLQTTKEDIELNKASSSNISADSQEQNSFL